MTKQTLEWLRWLVSVQQVTIGSPDAEHQVRAALAALAEIDAALQEAGP